MFYKSSTCWSDISSHSSYCITAICKCVWQIIKQNLSALKQQLILFLGAHIPSKIVALCLSLSQTHTHGTNNAVCGCPLTVLILC